MESTLAHNLALLRKKSPLSAFLLERVSSKEYIHSKEELSPLPKTGNLLLFLGLPFVKEIEEILLWLEEGKKRRCVFIETDPSLLRGFLETSWAEALLKHPQTAFLVSRGEKELKNWVHHALWGAVFYPDPLELMLRVNPFTPKALQRTFEFEVVNEIEKVRFSTESYNYALSPEKQYLQNFLATSNTLFANEIGGRLKDIPVVVLGAGHSLMEGIETLKRWQKYALIVTGGTTVNLLNEQGIKPHLTALFDPSLNQFAKWIAQKSRGIPTFICDRTHPWIVELLHAPRIIVPFNDTHADLGWYQELFKEDASFPDYINAGESTTNFLLEIMTASGAEPCLIVGADFSYSLSGARYPSKRVLHPLFEEYAPAMAYPLKKIETTLPSDPDKVFLMTGLFMHEVEWMRRFRERHLDYTYFHAKEEGAKLIGTKQLSLEDFEKRYLLKELPIEEIVHTEVFSLCHRIKSSERAREVLKVFQESFATIVRLADEALSSENVFEKERLLLLISEEVGYKKQLKIGEGYFIRMLYAHLTLFGKESISEEERVERHLQFIRENAATLVKIYEEVLAKESTKTPFYPNSSKVEKGKNLPFPYDAEGHLHGTVKRFGENDQLMAEANFLHGERVGISRRFYASGQLYLERDELSKKERLFYESGRLMSEFFPEEDLWIDYYEEGTIKRKEGKTSDHMWDLSGKLILEMRSDETGFFSKEGVEIVKR